MKNLFLLAAACTLFFSCTNLEKKAKALIQEDIEKNVFNLDSYKPLGYGTLEKVYSEFYLTDDGQHLLKEMTDADSLSKVYTNNAAAYLEAANNAETRYEALRYIEQKNEMTELAEEMTQRATSYVDTYNELKNTFASEPIGWKMDHSYRVNDKAERVFMMRSVYYFDEEVNKIISIEHVEMYEK